MKDLLFISLLEKNDYMGEKEIKEYFTKDVTVKAIKKGYPIDTKFKLALKEFESDGQKYVICFVFEDNDKTEEFEKIELIKLFEKSVVLLNEELTFLESLTE